MSAPSARGRGAAKAPRHAAKIIRFPTPEVVRRGQRKRLRGLVAVAVVLAAIAASEQFAGSESASTSVKPQLNPDVIEMRLLQLVNHVRESNGEVALTLSKPMMPAAYFHSSDMAQAGYLGYDGPAGDTPVDRLASKNISYKELAESVYRGEGDRIADLADRALMRWMANPLDRSHLLGPQFRTTAIGIARASDGSFLITQDFAR